MIDKFVFLVILDGIQDGFYTAGQSWSNKEAGCSLVYLHDSHLRYHLIRSSCLLLQILPSANSLEGKHNGVAALPFWLPTSQELRGKIACRHSVTRPQVFGALYTPSTITKNIVWPECNSHMPTSSLRIPTDLNESSLPASFTVESC